MRRRSPVGESSAHPSRLVSFRPEDWPGACHPECAYWRAVEEWQAEHPGEDLPLQDAPDLPWHPEAI